METIVIFLVAFGLSMDAFAVSVTNGVAIQHGRKKDALLFGGYFGFFQFLMTILGFFGTKSFAVYIQAYDHWIAFLLLSFVGGKMIYEAREDAVVCFQTRSSILKVSNMLSLSVATSIDALAVGVSFAFLETSILYASLVIGMVAFICSIIGVLIGKLLGSFIQKGAERIGGVILILIGARILAEHLFSYYH